jgi:uncharacterized protein (DUF1684 family)
MRALLLLPLLLAAAVPTADYKTQVEQWRKERERKLRADDGWLAVAGLFWLHEGSNKVGSEGTDEIVLPKDAGPAQAGTLEVSGKTVTLKLAPGVAATIADKPVTAPAVLRPDTSGTPDTVHLGRLAFFVIERGGKLGVRLKDPETPARRAFNGLTWFPIDESYRVTARFEPYNPPKSIPITNVLGQVDQMPSPGAFVFTLQGQSFRLDPVIEEPGDTQLFVMFKDLSSGKETYGAGRFLYTDMPKDGTVVLDFNRAYSPPCAFTSYATCPLPPRQNRLAVRIPAGEKKPEGLHH